jgi:hypothetical protein
VEESSRDVLREHGIRYQRVSSTRTTENTHGGRACAEETQRSGQHYMSAHPSGLEYNLDPQQRERSPSHHRPCIQWMSLTIFDIENPSMTHPLTTIVEVRRAHLSIKSVKCLKQRRHTYDDSAIINNHELSVNIRQFGHVSAESVRYLIIGNRAARAHTN